MRRRTLLLTAGLLAYFIGATVRVVYDRHAHPGDLRSFDKVGDRILAVAERPGLALEHPLLTIKFLVTADQSDAQSDDQSQ